MTKEYFMQLTTEEAVELIAQRVFELMAAKPLIAGPISTSSPPSEKIIGKKDVSKILNVSITTVTNWMKQGVLPFYRKGRRVFFKKQEIMACLEKPKNGKT